MDWWEKRCESEYIIYDDRRFHLFCFMRKMWGHEESISCYDFYRVLYSDNGMQIIMIIFFRESMLEMWMQWNKNNNIQGQSHQQESTRQ